VRGDRIVRIAALIVLCALVYYFSFDQGRRTLQSKIDRLENEKQSKDRLIENLAMEVRRQKEKTAALEKQLAPDGGRQTRTLGPEKSPARFLIRLGASRMLLEQRLAAALIDIDQATKTASLTLNFLRDGKTRSIKVQLGHSLTLSLDGASFTLLAEEVRPNAVVLRMFGPRG
jgi:hypothetical protein